MLQRHVLGLVVRRAANGSNATVPQSAQAASHSSSRCTWCLLGNAAAGFGSAAALPIGLMSAQRAELTRGQPYSRLPQAVSTRQFGSLTIESEPALRDYLARIKADYARLTASDAGLPLGRQSLVSAVDGGGGSSGDNPKLLSRLTLLARLIDEHEACKQAVASAAVPADLGGSNDDAELRQLMEQERQELLHEMRQAEARLLKALVPPEKGDDCSTVVEVTAGVGGQEAMLFSHELFTMYQRYSAYKGWTFELSEFDDSPDLPNSLRKGVAMISGTDVYKQLKFEGGVHRVQRIPLTEKAGRIHTSTVTVSVLPQPADIDVVLDPRHLRIDTFRSSGKGGQHVNKTESAVRITHLPTGTVAECQCERSQLRNRTIAMQVLRSRIFEAQLRQQIDAYNSARRLQVGSASRSEKIRTYNYCQDRVTDHRVKETVHGVERLLDGSAELDTLIELLQEASHSERLLELVRRTAVEAGAA